MSTLRHNACRRRSPTFPTPPQIPMSIPIPDNIGERTTPKLFGMFFNYGLMGALVVQVYQYYCAFPRDPKSTMALVYTLLLLELAETGMMSFHAYRVFGIGYGDLSALNDNTFVWLPAVILPSLTAAIVQTFYAHRVFRFTGFKIAGGGIAALTVLQFGAGLAWGAIINTEGNQSDFFTHGSASTVVWLTSAAVLNFITATSSVFQLRREISLDGNKFINGVRYVVETGFLAGTYLFELPVDLILIRRQAILAIFQLLIYLASPSHKYFETGVWTLGKLYSNTLLALLNARAVTVGGRDYEVPPPVPISNPATLQFQLAGGSSASWLTGTTGATEQCEGADETSDKPQNEPGNAAAV
ncbi:hypothetical protein FB45DRAFT_1103452 [Roridomyces roridus]|uniref:DUF6534 domain-containing protein n=1 Tax=Roridomyces roridus TaxID=1738132 RepID=A0AAD7BE74_9AGAR|nr:hypothetical protein FB45DRAFT_1103452 [Roridomyces roridus]